MNDPISASPAAIMLSPDRDEEAVPEKRHVEEEPMIKGPLSTSAETIWQISRQHFIPVPGAAGTGEQVIFRTACVLPAGRNGLLVQIQLDAPPPEGAHLAIQVVDLATTRAVTELSLSLADCAEPDCDRLILDFDLPAMASVEIVGITTMPHGDIRLRHLKIVHRPHERPLSLDSFVDRSASFRADRLKAVFVGTTNICNANCPHCPTNKTMTAHLERGVMDMQLYEALLEGLAGVVVDDALLFGVFGEPFADPLLEERIKLTRRLRPEIAIDIATNGALADPSRVAAIIDDVRRISIHIEACSAASYDKLMSPLKARDVFPRVDELIRRFGSKIAITTPLHRANVHEVPAIRERWSHHGTDVAFLPLQTRATDRTLAKRVNLAPAGGFWNADLVDILVIDWDGVVLATCDDFLRRQPLGDLRESSVGAILNGAPRREIFDGLRSHSWSKLPSLRDAVVDDAMFTEEFSKVAAPRMRWCLEADQFLIGDDARRTARGIALGSAGRATRPLVYGPYLRVPVGRYHLSFVGEAGTADPTARYRFEVSTDLGTRTRAAIERSGRELSGAYRVGMEFIHDAPDSLLEFRIFAWSGAAAATTLQRVELVRLND